MPQMRYTIRQTPFVLNSSDTHRNAVFAIMHISDSARKHQDGTGYGMTENCHPEAARLRPASGSPISDFDICD